MNPYDFVRVEWNNPGRKEDAKPIDRFGGISGRLEATITALTPIFIPEQRQSSPRYFLRNGQGVEIIPGSSLKGLFRSLVETVHGGAWWFFGDRNGTWRDNQVHGNIVNYNNNLPNNFKRPRNRKELDAACRMFGFLGSNSEDILLGQVSFDDAVCTNRIDHNAIYTCILSTPKPRHHVWYLDSTGNYVAGRKFYFHSQEPQTVSGWLPRGCVVGQNCQNAYIKPLDASSTFTFRTQFTNLDADDFALLLYAIVLEDGMRHKLGYAKPAGLGSVHVQLNWVDIVDYTARYRAGGGGFTRYAREGNGNDVDTLTPFVAQHIQLYTNNTTSVTLQDLRRIWRWPPVHVQTYPSRDWFTHHPNDPISATP